MNRLLDALPGLARVEFCGAFPEALLNRCAEEGLCLRRPERVDRFTLRAEVRERELDRLKDAAVRCQCEMTLLSLRGGSRTRRVLRQRVFLPLTGLLMLLLLALSSLFLWEIDVRGCETVSRGRVLRALSDCGVDRGSFWPGLSPDLVRGEMLRRLPELAWMTVNVSGSRAVVLVEERREKPEILREGEYCDLIAAEDGVVRRLSVLGGCPAVSPGQAVKRGELLISGRVESLSAPLRKVRAAGRVVADTRRVLTAVRPLEETQKTGSGRVRRRFALKIGKSRINLWPGTGKELDGYDKIVHDDKLGVEGLFALPLSLVLEERIPRKTQPGVSEAERELREHLLRELEIRTDGEILSASWDVSREGGVLKVTLCALCRENIAEKKP